MIRAADYLKTDAPCQPDQGTPEYRLDDRRDGLVMRLFGTLPDDADPRIAALRAEITAMDALDVYDLCRREGVEVLDDAGSPVPPWRDIAVLLLSRRRGLFGAPNGAAA